MQEIVCWNRVFHSSKVVGTVLEMLALPAGVLRSNSLAEHALHRKTLFDRSVTLDLGGNVAYLILILGPKLDKRVVHVVERRSR